LRKICLLLLAVLALLSVSAQGLLFNSNDSLVARRTSYDVFSGPGPEFRQSFSLNFDLSIWDKKHFGYVFSLKDANGKAYSLSYIFSDEKVGYLYLNIDNESVKIKAPLSPYRLAKRQWMPVQVNFDLKQDKVTMQVDGKSYVAGKMGLQELMKPRLVFGKCGYFTDVPSMAIRNLQVKDLHQQFFFPLNEWQGNQVHTKEGRPVGVADNPNWLINESWFWKERYKAHYDQVAGVAFNDSAQQVILFTRQNGTVYDLRQGQSQQFPFKNELPVPLILAKSQYNARENKLYVYEANNVPTHLPTIATLDLASRSWDTTGKAYIKTQRHHHNSFFDYNGKDLYLFGGYGSFSWFNQFYVYDRPADQWKEISFSGDTIMPRFFSASGKVNAGQELYIFGGFGNQSGSQIVGGKHLYDLYKINLNTRTIKKLWELKAPDENFVPANNLVISPDGKYFYVICYAHHIAKTSLQLYKFSIADGTYEIVSSPIPVVSEKIETDINLFYNEFTQEFYCAVQEFADATHSTVKLYSLAAPPVSYSAYVAATHSANGYSTLAKWILGLLLAGGLATAVHLFRKRPYMPAVNQPDEPGEAVLTLDLAPVNPLPGKNAVYLSGPFTVFDRKKTDITHLFSPKLRQLFILVLLSHKQGQGGVSSRLLSQVLWPDKEPSKTKNLRGVTLNNLRNVLNDLDGIRLSYINDSYCLELTEAFFCDYLAINTVLDAGQLPELALLLRGSLLPGADEGWIDEFKSRYESAVLSESRKAMLEACQAGDLNKAYHLTKVILLNDPFCEEAITYQLSILKKVKGLNAAKKRFEVFVQAYEQSMGESYPHSFEQSLREA
jgi:hypothetical protein